MKNNIEIVMKENYKEVEEPIILIGLPGSGLVGLISALHLIDSLEMEYVGHIESAQFPPIILIHDNELALPLRIYQKDNFLVIISEISIPTDPEMTDDIAAIITDWAKKLDPKFIIVMRGNPIPNRMNIEDPSCYGLGVSRRLNDMIESNECEIMEHGIMTGVDALILWKSFKLNLPAITLATDAFPNLPDPGAAAVLVDKLNALLGLDIDPAKLLENAEDLRIKMRDMMKNTSSTQGQMQNKEFQLPPMYG